MSATLKVSHRAIGVEVRRGTYDVLVNGERVGSLEMNNTFETSVEPGRHTLQVRNGRNSSRTKSFDATDDEIVAFRCSGKSILPIFLLSFVVPSLAISLHREYPRLESERHRAASENAGDESRIPLDKSTA
jgi:hypothetical protein